MFRDDVDRLFADLFPGGRHGASNEARAPVDVYLTDGPPPALTVEIDVAGVDPAQVDVALVEDVLVVRGERRRVRGRAAGVPARRDRLGALRAAAAPRASPWTRPRRRASYESGILRILLPLAPVAAAAPRGHHASARAR